MANKENNNNGDDKIEGVKKDPLKEDLGKKLEKALSKTESVESKSPKYDQEIQEELGKNFKFGQKVTIERTSGEIEDDWILLSVVESNKVKVRKIYGENGDKTMDKFIPKEDFLKLNSGEKPDEEEGGDDEDETVKREEGLADDTLIDDTLVGDKTLKDKKEDSKTEALLEAEKIVSTDPELAKAEAEISQNKFDEKELVKLKGESLTEKYLKYGKDGLADDFSRASEIKTRRGLGETKVAKDFEKLKLFKDEERDLKELDEELKIPFDEKEFVGKSPDEVEEVEKNWITKLWEKGKYELTDSNSHFSKWASKEWKVWEKEQEDKKKSKFLSIFQNELESSEKEISPEEKRNILRGLAGMGFKVQEWKGKGLKKLFDKLHKDSLKNRGEDNFMSRLYSSYSDVYKDVVEKAEKNKKELYEKGGTIKHGVGMGTLVGNALTYGRMTADFLWKSPTNPLRYVMIGGMAVGRGADALKEARFKSKEYIQEGRVHDEEEAARQAWDLYSKALKESEDGEISVDDLRETYRKNLPKDLLERINSNSSLQWNSFIKKDIRWAIHRMENSIQDIETSGKLSDDQKEQKKEVIRKKWDKFMSEMDKMISNSGKIDLLTYSGKLTATAAKGVVAAMAIETLAQGITRSMNAILDFQEGLEGESAEMEEFAEVVEKKKEAIASLVARENEKLEELNKAFEGPWESDAEIPDAESTSLDVDSSTDTARTNSESSGVEEGISEKPEIEKTPDVSETTTLPEAETVPEKISLEGIEFAPYEVKRGDKLWTVIEKTLEEKGLLKGFEGNEARKSFVTDSIVARLRGEVSDVQLKSMGISSGNPDLIYPGDKLELSEIMGDKKELENILNQAHGLSPEKIENIQKVIDGQVAEVGINPKTGIPYGQSETQPMTKDTNSSDYLNRINAEKRGINVDEYIKEKKYQGDVEAPEPVTSPAEVSQAPAPETTPSPEARETAEPTPQTAQEKDAIHAKKLGIEVENIPPDEPLPVESQEIPAKKLSVKSLGQDEDIEESIKAAEASITEKKIQSELSAEEYDKTLYAGKIDNSLPKPEELSSIKPDMEMKVPASEQSEDVFAGEPDKLNEIEDFKPPLTETETPGVEVNKTKPEVEIVSQAPDFLPPESSTEKVVPPAEASQTPARETAEPTPQTAQEKDAIHAKKLGIEVENIPPDEPLPVESQEATPKESPLMEDLRNKNISSGVVESPLSENKEIERGPFRDYDGPYDRSSADDEALLKRVREQQAVAEKINTVEPVSSTEQVDSVQNSKPQPSIEVTSEEELELMSNAKLEGKLTEIYGKNWFAGGGGGSTTKEWALIKNKGVKEFIDNMEQNYIPDRSKTRNPFSVNGPSPFVNPVSEKHYKVYKYIAEVFNKSGVEPISTESLESYLKRAVPEMIKKDHFPGLSKP